MNLVGKIFVGVIALMSVVCLTVSAVSYASHHSWKEKSAELADYKRIRKVEVYHEPLVRTSVGKVRRVTYKGKLDE